MLRDKYKLVEDDANSLADFLNSLLEVRTFSLSFVCAFDLCGYVRRILLLLCLRV